jgi:hypothetical protein
MQDLSQKCIFSGSTDNLNTIMTVTLDGEQYKVAVSEEHEDEAIPKKIRELIPDRLAEIDAEAGDRLKKLEQLAALAKELGVELGAPTGSGLVYAKETEQPPSSLLKESPPQPQPTRQPAPADPNALKDAPTIQLGGAQFKMQKNTRKNARGTGLSREETAAAFEAAKRRSQQSPENVANASTRDAPRYNAHSIPAIVESKNGGKLEKPTVFAKQVQTVKGREGVPVTIPRVLTGSDGETVITVSHEVDDKILRERTKVLDRLPDYAEQCRPCAGTGVVNRVNCIHCNGHGIVF